VIWSMNTLQFFRASPNKCHSKTDNHSGDLQNYWWERQSANDFGGNARLPRSLPQLPPHEKSKQVYIKG
jgi:hypothetical protein